jgi:hypothetical protein
MKTVKFLNKWFSWLRYIPFIYGKPQIIHVNTHGNLHMIKEEKITNEHRVSSTNYTGPR